MTTHCYIHGFGVYVPSRVLTNDDLSKFVDTSDEWITTRTGIKERYILADDEQVSDLGLQAAQKALKNAELTAQDVTHILFATCSPEYLTPAASTILAGKLGCGTVMAMDFNAACSGFIYGLALAETFTTVHKDAVVLLVCAEALSRRLNWQDRTTCVLFGDGAGAFVLKGKPSAKGSPRISNAICHSDGTLSNLITIGGGTKKTYEPDTTIDEDFFLQMQGREVFKHAVRNLAKVCHEVLEQSGYTLDDISLFVPHQANLRIIEAVGSRLGIAEEKVFSNVHKYGNTSSASVPLALGDARDQGLLKKGERVLVAGVGAGFTWGAALITY